MLMLLLLLLEHKSFLFFADLCREDRMTESLRIYLQQLKSLLFFFIINKQIFSLTAFCCFCFGDVIGTQPQSGNLIGSILLSLVVK